MAPDLRSRRFLVLCCLLVLTALAGCDSAESHRVCATCEGNAYPNVDYDAVDHSTVDIWLDDRGNAQWTTTVDMAAWAEPPSEATIRDVFSGNSERRFVPIHDGDTRNVTIRRSDGGFTISFTVSGMADGSEADTLVVDYFNTVRHGEGSYGLGADVVRLHAPAGRTVINSPPRATVTDDGSTVVWREDGPPADDEIDAGTYVVVGEARTPGSQVRGKTVVLGRLLALGGVATLLMTLLGSVGLAGTTWWAASRFGESGRRFRDGPGGRRRAVVGGLVVATTVVGATAVRLPFAGDIFGLYGELFLVGCLGIAGLVGVAITFERDHRLSGPLAAGVVLLPVYPAALVQLTTAGTPGVQALWLHVVWTLFVAVGGLVSVRAARALFGWFD